MKSMKFLTMMSFLLVMALSSGFAQEGKSSVEFKNEGNEALRGNNFKQALELFESAIAVWPAEEEMDAVMIFNAATCARREKDSEKALKYYAKSQELGYKSDMSAYYRASSLKDLDREVEMEELLLKSIQEFSTSNTVGHMKKMLVTYYLKQGSEPYNRASETLKSAANADPSQYAEITSKANEAFVEAKPWFEKALELDAANENALAALKAINEKLAAK
jgi:tetratricopeptide (TPR) repeat protein